MNVFTGVDTTIEQTHDLLNVRNMGENHYKYYISHHILQVPSSNALLILTMAPPKHIKTKRKGREGHK